MSAEPGAADDAGLGPSGRDRGDALGALDRARVLDPRRLARRGRRAGRASRTSSSTCCSRARTASARARSTRLFDAHGRGGERRHGQGDDLGLLALPRPAPRARLRRDARTWCCGPSYPDIDSERQVVIEEIAMYEDEPSDKVHDVLAGADLRRPPARAADHRPRRRDRRRCRSRRSPPGTTARYVPAQHRRRGGGQPRPRPRSWRWSTRLRAGDAPARGAARRERARRRSRRALRFHAQGDRAVPPLPRRPGHRRAATTAASRCACSTRSSAARPRRGCSRRCARSAASPTRSTRTPSQYADSGQVGALRRHAARQRRRGDAR